MQYERRVVDAEKGIVQITTEDERFYSKIVDGKEIWIPSVTWICEYLPKSVAFYKWLASKGWDESQAIKEAAGEKGTYVHKACEMLMNGSTINFNSIVVDRELTTEEYAAVMSFVQWFNLVKPEIINTELTVFAQDDRYAGTLDLICKINKEHWIIDLKTSSNVWPSHEIQVTAYRHAIPEIEQCKMGILQLGYKYNKNQKYKLTTIKDKWDLFNSAYTIWQDAMGEVHPLQKDYPLSLSLNIKEEK